MVRGRLLVIIAACLLIGLAAGQERGLRVVVTPDDQDQSRWDPNLKWISPDIPLDDPEVARQVRHYEPEGIHLAPWQLTDDGWTILVSWQTGEGRIGRHKHPPKPHNPRKVPGVVRYGTQPGQLDFEEVGNKDIVYAYRYGKDVGGTTYQSPIIHHVLLRELTPGTKIYYKVGSVKYGFSEERHFRVPGGMDQLPVRIGLIGDLGQTRNSSATVHNLRRHLPDVVLHVGDSCYADDYCSDAKSTYCKYSSDQRRWDSWARMTEPLFSKVPMLHIHGNHDREMQTTNQYQTFKSINARYPLPQNPSVINTSPNYAYKYLDVKGVKLERFINGDRVQPNNSFYSVDLPGTHLIALSTYLPYGRYSRQHQWFIRDIAAVDRTRTPWLIVMFHTSPRNNYAVHFKECEEFMELYEPTFYQYGVDLVFSGHTHAYERTQPMYKYKVDECGPMYTCIGDGGNMEGLARWFIDDQPPAFCDDPARFATPQYQPTLTGKPKLSFQDGRFCPERQPDWSAYRDPSFGHGLLTIHNSTHAEWAWYRNQDGEAVARDHVWIERSQHCSVSRPRRAYAFTSKPAAPRQQQQQLSLAAEGLPGEES